MGTKQKSKSLLSRNNKLANSSFQLNILNGKKINNSNFAKFADKVEACGYKEFKPYTIDTLQINLGKLCNLACAHCHVDAGPDRKEIMEKDLLEICLSILKNPKIKTVDLTGGAPEMNPNFKWFIEEVSRMKKHIIIRTNLTIITSNEKYSYLPEFFAKHNVEIVCSLPHYNKRRTDQQRGDGVYDDSIKALKLLNKAGYGQLDSDLKLNIVFNPTGAFLPSSQSVLESQYKRNLKRNYNIEFNNLFTITNLPISRFLDYLLDSGQYEEYMQKLIDSFNPAAVENVMCRNIISISWDGYIHDCDFNQILNLRISAKNNHIKDFSYTDTLNRSIILDQHCYGCTAGAGSSCSGETI